MTIAPIHPACGLRHLPEHSCPDGREEGPTERPRLHPWDCPWTAPLNHRPGTPGCVETAPPHDPPHDARDCPECDHWLALRQHPLVASSRRLTIRLTPILEDVTRERQRQEEIGEAKRAAGIDWRSCADPAMAGGDDRRYAVLGEEVGEVARALLERGFVPKHLVGQVDAIGDPELRAELVQVAAVAVAWVEAIDRRNERGAEPLVAL